MVPHRPAISKETTQFMVVITFKFFFPDVKIEGTGDLKFGGDIIGLAGSFDV